MFFKMAFFTAGCSIAGMFLFTSFVDCNKKAEDVCLGKCGCFWICQGQGDCTCTNRNDKTLIGYTIGIMTVISAFTAGFMIFAKRSRRPRYLDDDQRLDAERTPPTAQGTHTPELRKPSLV